MVTRLEELYLAVSWVMQSDIMATSIGARLRLGATSAVGSLFLWHLVAKMFEMNLSITSSIYSWCVHCV